MKKKWTKLELASPQLGQNNNSSGTIFINTNFNFAINAEKSEELIRICTNTDISHAIVVYGEKRLGKRTCIQNMLYNKNNLVKICSYYENQFQLEPIIYAFNLDVSKIYPTNDLGFGEQIKKMFFCIVKNKIQ